MILHNRIGLAALVAAFAIVFMGAGCGKQAAPVAPPSTGTTGADSGTQAPTADAGGPGGATLPTRWSEYRSEALGITIPYPEGWYVSESGTSDGGSGGVKTILIDPAPLPSAGDLPIRVIITVSSHSLEDVLATYESATTMVTMVGGASVTKVEYQSELGGGSADEPLQHEAYHWRRDDRLYIVDGERGDAVVAYIASTLATREE